MLMLISFYGPSVRFQKFIAERLRVYGVLEVVRVCGLIVLGIAIRPHFSGDASAANNDAS